MSQFCRFCQYLTFCQVSLCALKADQYVILKQKNADIRFICGFCDVDVAQGLDGYLRILIIIILLP